MVAVDTSSDTGLRRFASMPALKRGDRRSLSNQIADWVAHEVERGRILPASRIPSIRWLAEFTHVSFSTVVDAYDQLVARGYLDSRRGSGYFVRARPTSVLQQALQVTTLSREVDWIWLGHNLRTTPIAQHIPGSGLMPEQWFDPEPLAAALRAISKQNIGALTRYGDPLGFLPLRRQLQLKLADIGIGSTLNQIILTSGVTQALEIVARTFLKTGDYVLVDDPGYPVAFAQLSALGIKLVGLPWTTDGPDVDIAESLLRSHRPKLYISNPILHNPTGESISPAKAHRLLQLAETYDTIIFENDVSADLARPHLVRIAALDQLRRVIYASSFAKTLAPGLHVGFLACGEALTGPLLDQKMLTAPISGAIGERLVQHILSTGHYRKHLARLRGKLDAIREPTTRRLRKAGVSVEHPPDGGLFVWADLGIDTKAMAERGLEAGLVFAPGSLFSPSSTASTHMRFNIATCSSPSILEFLGAELRGNAAMGTGQRP